MPSEEAIREARLPPRSATSYVHDVLGRAQQGHLLLSQTVSLTEGFRLLSSLSAAAGLRDRRRGRIVGYNHDDGGYPIPKIDCSPAERTTMCRVRKVIDHPAEEVLLVERPPVVSLRRPARAAIGN